MESWSKAESCYILSLARLQRLQEAAARPHQDIRPSEAEVACRLSEHLLYLVQRGREALSNFSMEMRELSAVIRLLDDLSTDSTINQQDASELSKKLEISSHLVRLTRETEELLSAAGRFEPYSENSKFLSSASSAARAMWIKLDSCVSDVISTSSNSVCLDANRREIFVTPSMHESLNALGGMIKELSNEVCDSEHQKVPGWTELGNAFSSAVSAYQEINRHRDLVIDNDQCSIASDIESMVEACLLWVQNECFLSKRDETSELSRHTEDCREVVLSFMNALRRSNAKGLKLVNDRAGISINKLAGLSSSQNDACIRSNTQLLMSTRVLLKVLLSASWSAGCHLMALHRSIAKLTYITCGILATVVQDGFCMPEEEGEEVTEGEVKEMHGTGLADGDTRGAKDISDEIEDEDQVLGAQQKGQEKEEHPQPEQQDEKDASRGIEMEDDFEGALEDVKQDLDNDQDDSLDEEDGDAERLDQQMGDVGEEGLEVDERLWNEEDGGADRQEEKYDQKQTLEVKDTSDMEYAQGQEKQEAAEDDRKKSTEVEKEERRVEDAFDEDGLGDNGEENETMEGQTEEGRTQLEQPDAELQIPENWDLDDGEADEEEVGEQGEDEKELLEELQLGEDGKKEDEKPDFPEDNGEGGDSEMQQPQDMEHNNENEETEGFGGQNTMPFDGTDEVEDKEEDKENDADLKVQDKQEGASEVLEDALQGGDHGQNAPNKGQMPVDGLQNNEDENQAYADDKEAAIASTGGETTGPGGGLADLMTNDQSNYQDRKHSQGPQQQDAGLSREQANPLRNLGSAIQEWRKRLALLADLNGEQKHDDAVDLGNEADTPEGETAEGAYRFLGEDETPTMGKDTQVLARATDEQIDTQMAEGDVAVIDDEDAEMDEYNEPQAKEDMATQPTGSEAKETVDGSRGEKKTKLHGEAPVIEEPGSGDEGMQGKELTDTDVEKNPTTDVGLESLISTKFQATHIDDDDILDLKETMLPMERAAALREELMKRLEAVQVSAPSAGDEDYGRQAWERCEMLTSSLVGELTEQLRLILEPTIASKMGGEFRTGKRINMKRVIAYIASQFRKDKIWMRRSHPDKRRYQVLIAVDNSRSMAETGCGPFALEAVTLIARAMSRLEVGELGVVSFGGPGGAQPLHNFDENFSDADGIRIMSSLRFDQDNTIKDRPMEDVILSVDALLENASLRFSSMSGGTGSLHQLVLIVADGRFHEKESLQLAVRNASERPGVLYAFLVLDNSVNSVLDMQSVAFENGKPVFTKYIDSFPFPYYIVLRNTAALPRTLADLLRQWFEMQQG